jgi:hypothetical protein
VALLEAVVALAILGTAGISLVGYVSESLHALEMTHVSEHQLARSSAFLDAVVLWPRADLDRHLGARREGEWILRIERSNSRVYVVTLVDSTNRGTVLETSVYRNDDDKP